MIKSRSYIFLVQSRADVNIKDSYGRTPLHHAVQLNSEAILVLLANGADVNIKDNNELTPLHYAAVLIQKLYVF